MALANAYTNGNIQTLPYGQNPIRIETSIKGMRGMSLTAEVHDALWMLTQQHRIGEFKAMDGGSAISVQAQVKSKLINRFEGNGVASKYDHTVPMEALAEKMVIKPDLRLRMQMGKQWFRFLRAQNPGIESLVFQKSLTEFPLIIPQITGSETQAERESKFAVLSDGDGMSVRSGLSGKIADGWELYQLLDSTGSNADEVIDYDGGSHASDVIAAAGEFIKWFKRVYLQPESATDELWQKNSLEYSFKCSAPDTTSDSADQHVLMADQYSSGTLDWYSFDKDPAANAEITYSEAGLNQNVDDENEPEWDVIKSEYVNLNPGHVRFKGMPVNRWWQYEDGQADLASVMTGKRDLIKMMMMDFGLIYSNDWFVIPVKLHAGALHEMDMVVVKDVFGKYTVVNNCGDGTSKSWQTWNMFHLNKRFEQAHQKDSRLYVPPTMVQLQESEAVEKVAFVRDEMANMVWGIEKVVQSDIGSGVPGKEAHDDLETYLEEQNIYDTSSNDDDLNYTGAELKYQLSNEVPENWIPFIPVKKTGDRDIVFQRAAMNRILNSYNTGETVKPKTSIINHDSPYYINEEEILRSGTSVSATYQRTRWYNGKIVLWKGMKRSLGRGEGDSGLQFDFIKSTEESDFT